MRRRRRLSVLDELEGLPAPEHAQLEAIARQLERELAGLDVLDLSIPRAQPWRYRSESDDTWKRLHRAVVPTVEAMQQLTSMGRPRSALTVLRGILLALYALRSGDGGELLQSAPDFPTATAKWVWDVWWKATHGRPPLPEAFLTGQVPEWTWLRRAPHG